jgi:hypothetical protein
MTLYKLKPEARQFLPDWKHSKIMDQYAWANINVPLYLLEEVTQNRVQLGYDHGNGKKELSGYNSNGARFYFTLHFPGMTSKQYDEFNIVELQYKFNEIVKNIIL